MLTLHVWGDNHELSIISPECVASAWMLIQSGQEYEIVTSCNTNMSDIHQLPVLIQHTNEEDHEENNGEAKQIDEKAIRKYQGFTEISHFLTTNQPQSSESLLDLATLNLLQTKLSLINEYNLYVCTQNYEKYTRKLFSRYFPFPMMYNQPLKYYNNAVEKVKMIGLNSNSTSFFSLGNDVAETEYVNDDLDDEDEVPLSALHESRILAKSKEKKIWKELKNAQLCLRLCGEIISKVVREGDIKSKVEESKEIPEAKENPESAKNLKESTDEKNTDVNTNDLLVFPRDSPSEYLFHAYMRSLTSSDLPDQFLVRYLRLKFPEVINYTEKNIANKMATLTGANIRSALGTEVPSLVNEVRYWIGV